MLLDYVHVHIHVCDPPIFYSEAAQPCVQELGLLTPISFVWPDKPSSSSPTAPGRGLSDPGFAPWTAWSSQPGFSPGPPGTHAPGVESPSTYFFFLLPWVLPLSYLADHAYITPGNIPTKVARNTAKTAHPHQKT